MPRIDPQSAADVRALLDRATKRGKDPVLALEELGMLLYPAMRRHLMAAALREAAGVLEELTVKQLAGSQRQALSPLDTKRHTVAWLRAEAQKVEES